MKSKIIITMMLLLSAVGWARAQEELTVYDNAGTNSRIPAYILYWDDFTRSQTVCRQLTWRTWPVAPSQP